MSRIARRQYLIAIIERYQKATKREKAIILNEFCAVCGYHRKYAIRVLNSPISIRKNRPGPPKRYNEEVLVHLKALWYAMGRICSKRVRKALPEWISYYTTPITDNVKLKLLKISSSSIDRLLKPERKQHGVGTTKPAKYWYKSRISIQPDEFGLKEPGSVTADTVAHCGESAAGTFIYTLTMTDLASTLTVNRSIWGKTQEEVKNALNELEKNLSFPLKNFKSDSGSKVISQMTFSSSISKTFNNSTTEKISRNKSARSKSEKSYLISPFRSENFKFLRNSLPKTHPNYTILPRSRKT